MYEFYTINTKRLFLVDSRTIKHGSDFLLRSSFFAIPFDFFEADGYIMQVYFLKHQITHPFTS